MASLQNIKSSSETLACEKCVLTLRSRTIVSRRISFIYYVF
jgi:hypothetical protein